MGTLLFMAPEQTKNQNYGKVNLKTFYLQIIENRHMGYGYHNVSAAIREASPLH